VRELARTTATFTESVIREMTRISDAVGGYNLAQGFPDFEAPEEIKQAAIKSIQQNRNQYPVTFGEPELRKAISEKAERYNHITCDPDTEITVTCGATEAMIATLKAVVNPGDEVIIFEPFYENYGPDAILSGAKPRYVTLHPPDWTYQFEDLERAFNGRTKAIIINTPNNPTGKVFSRRELEEISKLCNQWDCLAITDEIYEHILYDDHQHISIGSLDGMKDRTITISSISKTYAVTGWRVGWAIAAERITREIRKVHDFLTVGAPTPLQHAAAFALSSMPECYYEELRTKYNRSRRTLFEILSRVGFKPCLPGGAYYIIAAVGQVREKLSAEDDVSFSRQLTERIGVATVPGTSFYASPSKGLDQVRFCFCKKPETLEKVRERLQRLL
jgi:aspartate/methionine/tyrosine aminotransferase